ncbi:YdcF family protein [Paenibacillus xerothermodurans]|uniref:YdcF family protein n=1 Tax=Paenibacillus xerothermodurans TaxID=1977292 RepID=UPI001402E681|nr:YdcF family protein [Paenibacillus xerothermodurans]
MSDKRAGSLVMYTALCAGAGGLLLLIFGASFGVFFIIGLCMSLLCVRAVSVLCAQTDKRIYKIIHITLLAGLLGFICSFLVIESIIVASSRTDQTALEDADYMIVLGAGLKGSALSDTLQRRLDTSIQVIRGNPAIPVILSGGQGSDEHLSEAEAMYKYLVSHGIPRERLLLENKSTSTEENLLFSKELMSARGAVNPRVAIVTSDFHLFRAKLLARQIGLPHTVGIASSSPFFVEVNYLIREYFGVLYTLLLPERGAHSTMADAYETQ